MFHYKIFRLKKTVSKQLKATNIRISAIAENFESFQEERNLNDIKKFKKS